MSTNLNKLLERLFVVGGVGSGVTMSTLAYLKKPITNKQIVEKEDKVLREKVESLEKDVEDLKATTDYLEGEALNAALDIDDLKKNKEWK